MYFKREKRWFIMWLFLKPILTKSPSDPTIQPSSLDYSWSGEFWTAGVRQFESTSDFRNNNFRNNKPTSPILIFVYRSRNRYRYREFSWLVFGIIWTCVGSIKRNLFLPYLANFHFIFIKTIRVAITIWRVNFLRFCKHQEKKKKKFLRF